MSTEVVLLKKFYMLKNSKLKHKPKKVRLLRKNDHIGIETDKIVYRFQASLYYY